MASEDTRQLYQLVDGIKVPRHFNADVIRQCMNYAVQSGDIFIVTYPKCGTTWMQVILFGLLNNGKAFDEDHGYFFAQTPFIERLGIEVLQKMKRPGTIKTHLSLDHIPYHSKAKYIYLLRDPRDVCVSFYKFLLSDTASSYYNEPFDVFYEDFINGVASYGDYFEHLKSLSSKIEAENLLVLHYEDLKKDLKGNILKIIDFLKIHIDDEALDKVIHFSSFEYMKIKYDAMRNSYNKSQVKSHNTLQFNPSTIVRKGEVGGFRHLMTDEQAQRLLERAKELQLQIPHLKLSWF